KLSSSILLKKKEIMERITPCLWFDKNCEEAMNYYVDVFNGAPSKTQDSKIISIKRYEEGMQAPRTSEMIGKMITGVLEINGQRFMGLDGGQIFNFTEAVSFEVDCEDQAEVDYFWEKLSAHPENEQCGWCKDKFGLSWQIVPKRMTELFNDSDNEKA